MNIKGMSNYKKRLIGGMILYGILSLGVIPIFTLYMGTQDNILNVSMSAMGNTSTSMHILFVVWTLIFCGYFASFMGYLLMLTKNTHSKIRGFVTFATVVLIVGNIFPFLPETLPGFAEMHNLFAQISSVSLAVTLMLFTLTLRNHYSVLFKKALVFVLIIWAMLIALMAIFGTKSITEMSGIIVAGVFLFCVLTWLFKEDAFDPVQSLKEKDVLETKEAADKLEKRVMQAKKEYLKLEAEARRARITADEVAKIAKHHKAEEK
ncbi:MAG: hypothetical protein VB081_03995 [Christensenella sp.]|uniref:hypothetical protein n=1 Tax=Christensenella sp. TaxID=1935934 RepID=UPI002B21CBDA|nr:hypothetical protein [Christensenella sp.]MEA5002640.1 hypothetical protein [Christensenella sp.]